MKLLDRGWIIHNNKPVEVVIVEKVTKEFILLDKPSFITTYKAHPTVMFDQFGSKYQMYDENSITVSMIYETKEQLLNSFLQ